MITLMLRFSGIIAGGLAGILAWKLLPLQISGRSAMFLTDFMKTYVTIATILIGFSAGITNNFITGTNERMMKLLRKHDHYRDFLWQFHASTVVNFLGMLAGMAMIMILEYIPDGNAARCGAITTFAIAAGGAAMFIAAAWSSALIANKTDELYGDE